MDHNALSASHGGMESMSGAWQEQPAKLLHHYDRSAQHAAHEIIRRYSSSFFLASNLLRGHVKLTSAVCMQ